MKKEFKYEIKNHIGTICTSHEGVYAMEVNMISFNNAPAKVDIRTWNKITGQMYKGITLTKEQTEELLKILQEMKDNDWE